MGIRPGHLLLAVKALHREKIKQRWPKTTTKDIKIKFELQTFNLHQIIQRELMICIIVNGICFRDSFTGKQNRGNNFKSNHAQHHNFFLTLCISN